MAEFHTVAQVGDLNEGEAKVVKVQRKMIALFMQDGQYYAIDDTCPHMGASLAGGMVQNSIVTCPWHGWRFSIEDGTWVDNPRLQIGCYPVRVSEGLIQIEMESASPATEESEGSQT